MKRHFKIMLGLLAMGVAFLSSCEETKEADPYANWEVRNSHFIDSIADVAKANADGTWVRLRSYTQTESTPGTAIPAEGKVGDYIYAKKLFNAEGDNTTLPVYTDSVAVHYRGKLINGTAFDQSYSEVRLDSTLAQATNFKVGGLTTGFATAIQHMREADRTVSDWRTKGDRWLVYIPYELGYGTSGSGSTIPGYSVLIFDIKLVSRWAAGEKQP